MGSEMCIRDRGCANCSGACATLPVRSGRGVFRSSLPGPVTSCSGVLSTLRRDARVADLTTSFVAALVTLRTALRPCHPRPVHTKNCSSVSWSGPACPPVFPARASAAACCPLCSCALFRLAVLSSVSLPWAAWLSSLALRLLSLSALLRLSVASPSWPLAFGLLRAFGSVVVVVLCWRSAGLRLFLCLPVPCCCKLVLSTFTEH